MQNTTAEDFAADIGTGTTVVMFHAVWCGPCRMYKPLVEQLAAEQGFKLIGVDAGEHRMLAAANGVRAVPVVTVFRDGAIQGRLDGPKTDFQLRSFLAAAGVPA